LERSALRDQPDDRGDLHLLRRRHRAGHGAGGVSARSRHQKTGKPLMFRYEKADGIAVLTLDNPPVNVLTPEQHEELYHILKDFYSDPEVRCGIWTGAGERAFCAGDDVKSERTERSTAEIVDRHLTPR